MDDLIPGGREDRQQPKKIINGSRNRAPKGEHKVKEIEAEGEKKNKMQR